MADLKIKTRFGQTPEEGDFVSVCVNPIKNIYRDGTFAHYGSPYWGYVDFNVNGTKVRRAHFITAMAVLEGLSSATQP